MVQASAADVAAIGSLQDKERHAAAMQAVAAAMGEITSLMIRSPQHANFTVADLEWLIVPALQNKQFLLVHVPRGQGQPPVPAAAVLWATVSPELDAQLRMDPSIRLKLSAEHRTSGSHVWLTDMIGDPRAGTEGVEQLRRTTFKGRSVTFVSRDPSGTPLLVDRPAV
jgi:cytolysin-activating lysine-acyltransferase